MGLLCQEQVIGVASGWRSIVGVVHKYSPVPWTPHSVVVMRPSSTPSQPVYDDVCVRDWCGPLWCVRPLLRIRFCSHSASAHVYPVWKIAGVAALGPTEILAMSMSDEQQAAVWNFTTCHHEAVNGVGSGYLRTRRNCGRKTAGFLLLRESSFSGFCV